jgi:hypothetical protein
MNLKTRLRKEAVQSIHNVIRITAAIGEAVSDEKDAFDALEDGRQRVWRLRVRLPCSDYHGEEDGDMHAHSL